jgi:uncharacterized membrane protein YbaN (DUF454 family)
MTKDQEKIYNQLIKEWAEVNGITKAQTKKMAENSMKFQMCISMNMTIPEILEAVAL